MDWNYFNGYEDMILILGLLLYGLIPWASIYITGKYIEKKYTFLAPIGSIIILYLFAAIFLFLFSSADMGKVFNGLYQLLASLAILILYWLYQFRARIAEKPAYRWGSTALMGFVSGIAILLSGWYSFYNFGLAGLGVRYPARIPHSGPAGTVMFILLAAYYLSALLIVGAIHKKGIIVFLIISILVTVGVYSFLSFL